MKIAASPEDDKNNPYNYSLGIPNSSIPDVVHHPVPPGSPSAGMTRGGRAQATTEELRQSVVRWLNETEIPRLKREAKRIAECCTREPFPGAPSEFGNKCNSVLCPACDRRRIWKNISKLRPRMEHWAASGLRIVHFIVTLPHNHSDEFSAVADAMLEVLRKLPRTRAFKQSFLDYTYGVHCRFTKKGPHPHAHVYVAVADSPASELELATEIKCIVFGQLAPLVRRVTTKRFGEARDLEVLPASAVRRGNLGEAISRLACYSVKAVANEDDIPFGLLTADQILDLFLWLGGDRGRRRRLTGAATGKHRNRHGL